MSYDVIDKENLKDIKDAISAASIHIQGGREITAAFVLGQCYSDLAFIIGNQDDAGNSVD